MLHISFSSSCLLSKIPIRTPESELYHRNTSSSSRSNHPVLTLRRMGAPGKTATNDSGARPPEIRTKGRFFSRYVSLCVQKNTFYHRDAFEWLISDRWLRINVRRMRLQVSCSRWRRRMLTSLGVDTAGLVVDTCLGESEECIKLWEIFSKNWHFLGVLINIFSLQKSNYFLGSIFIVFEYSINLILSFQNKTLT